MACPRQWRQRLCRPQQLSTARSQRWRRHWQVASRLRRKRRPPPRRRRWKPLPTRLPRWGRPQRMSTCRLLRRPMALRLPLSTKCSRRRRPQQERDRCLQRKRLPPLLRLWRPTRHSHRTNRPPTAQVLLTAVPLHPPLPPRLPQRSRLLPRRLPRPPLLLPRPLRRPPLKVRRRRRPLLVTPPLRHPLQTKTRALPPLPRLPSTNWMTPALVARWQRRRRQNPRRGRCPIARQCRRSNPSYRS